MPSCKFSGAYAERYEGLALPWLEEAIALRRSGYTLKMISEKIGAPGLNISWNMVRRMLCAVGVEGLPRLERGARVIVCCPKCGESRSIRPHSYEHKGQLCRACVHKDV